MHLVLAVLMSSFLSQSVLAMSEEEAYQALKNSDVYYEPEGAVCEQVAKLEMQQEYPASQFHIVTGIEYGDLKSTVGELDVVVFDRVTNKAILVAEVKCWRSIEGAKKKAKDQRNRFIRYINSNFKLFFRSEDASYDRYQLEDVRQFISIAQKGSRKKGFDRELSLSLEDLMSLRRRLLSCQAFKSTCD